METVILFNIKEILEEAIFRRKIKALGTYESFDEVIDVELAKAERLLAEDPDDFPFDEWPED